MAVRTLTIAAALLLALFTTGPAGAVTAWNDVTTDLSNLHDFPTSVPFVPGQNDIIGQTGKGDSGTDRDYFTFVVPEGYVLDSLKVLNVQLAPLSKAAFLGLQSGDEVISFSGPDPGLLLGYWHFAPGDIDSDILDDIGSRPDAQGFTPPLPPGTYSVWIQDTNLGATLYTLQFVVRASSPATAFLTLAGLAGLVGMRLAGNRIGRRRTPVRDDR